jgi:hypothetical protein
VSILADAEMDLGLGAALLDGEAKAILAAGFPPTATLGRAAFAVESLLPVALPPEELPVSDPGIAQFKLRCLLYEAVE